jgi:hypothetical protein
MINSIPILKINYPITKTFVICKLQQENMELLKLFELRNNLHKIAYFVLIRLSRFQFLKQEQDLVDLCVWGQPPI